MGLLVKMRKEKDFNDREKSICNFLLENYDKIADMPSREVGSYTFTSSSSVVRFCQKLGCKGYSDFKVQFLSEMRYAEVLDANQEMILSEEDNAKSILDKVTAVEKLAIEETRSDLSVEKIMKVSSYIEAADYIDFFAYDLNLYLAQYACNQFFHCGKISTIYSASNEQQLLALTAKSDHIGIFISRNGENSKLIAAAKALKKSNVKTLVITMNKESTLAKICDEYIYAVHNTKIEQFGSTVFSTSVKYIIDIFYSMIFVNKYKESMNLNKEYDVFGQKAIYDR